MAEQIVGNIVGFISCLLCAFPFLIISIYNKDSITPISFWSRDNTLKDKINNIPAYNKEMASLYKKCAIAFIVTGIGCLIHLMIGITLLIICCTFGFYLVYKKYKSILNQYSKNN